MTFCPNCGASLKAQAAWQPGTGATSAPPYYYRHRHEKEEKNEKQEKHEKQGGSYGGMLIAGLVVLFIGVLAYVNATTGFLNGPQASAAVLVIIGVIILFAALYYTSVARRRNPAPS